MRNKGSREDKRRGKEREGDIDKGTDRKILEINSERSEREWEYIERVYMQRREMIHAQNYNYTSRYDSTQKPTSILKTIPERKYVDGTAL